MERRKDMESVGERKKWSRREQEWEDRGKGIGGE